MTSWLTLYVYNIWNEVSSVPYSLPLPARLAVSSPGTEQNRTATTTPGLLTIAGSVTWNFTGFRLSSLVQMSQSNKYRLHISVPLAHHFCVLAQPAPELPWNDSEYQCERTLLLIETIFVWKNSFESFLKVLIKKPTINWKKSKNIRKKIEKNRKL